MDQPDTAQAPTPAPASRPKMRMPPKALRSGLLRAGILYPFIILFIVL